MYTPCHEARNGDWHRARRDHRGRSVRCALFTETADGDSGDAHSHAPIGRARVAGRGVQHDGRERAERGCYAAVFRGNDPRFLLHPRHGNMRSVDGGGDLPA